MGLDGVAEEANFSWDADHVRCQTMVRMIKANDAGATPVKRLIRGVLRRSSQRSPAANPVPPEAKPLLSVVMPVYNVETYLPEAVQSILDQSYRTVELILVDDGSTDRSGQMCDEYAASDPRVRVIHKDNAGLGAARNSGIEESRGHFLTFVDSDDFLLPDAYKLMVGSLRRSKSDFATGNVQRRQGQRRWQAWNQSRSHVKSQIGIRVGENPDLIWDSIAVNKVFRRSFWKEHVDRFPEGVLYEDLVPMARALLAANSIDVFSKPVYVWRSRDEGDSISQRRIELVNLTDRLNTVDQIHRMIIEAGADKALLDVFFDKILSNDIGTYVHFIDEAEPAFVKLVEEACSRYWGKASVGTRSRLPIERKILLQLLCEHNTRGAIEARTWFADLTDGLPTTITNGRVRLDQSGLSSLSPHEEDWLLSLDDEAVARATITDLQWTDSSALVVRGYAYIPLISSGDQEIDLVATNRSDGDVVVFPSDRVASPEAARWASDVSQPHDSDGFRCTIDPNSLLRRDPDGKPIASMWEFQIRVTHNGLERTTSASNIWRGGAAAVIPAAMLTTGMRAIPRTDAGRALRLEFRTSDVFASRVSVDGKQVTVVFGGSRHAGIEGVAFKNVESGAVIHAEAVPDSSGNCFVADLPVQDVPRTTWLITARAYGRNLPVLSGASARFEQQPGRRSLVAESDRNGQAIITGRNHAALVEAVALTSESTLHVGGTVFGTGPIEIGVAPDGQTPSEWVDAKISPDTFEADVPLTRSDADGVECALPSGRFTVVARESGASKEPVHLVLADSAATTLPLHCELPLFRAQLDRVGAAAMRLEVTSPVPAADLGAFAQKMIRRGFAKTDPAATDSVFVDLNLGPELTERSIEILAELARVGGPTISYWGVDDLSKSLPPSCLPVLRGSRVWAEKLAQSKYVIHNSDLASYRIPPHQVRLAWLGPETLSDMSALFVP